ncbi:MAG: hypothetical protein ABF868_00675 [Sporolactobacillus sp.]
MSKWQWSVFFAAGVAGFAAGWHAQQLSGNAGRPLRSEAVLGSVKKSVRQTIDVEGGWIFTTPHTEKTGMLVRNVYQGGLTASSGTAVKHYAFTADAQTGTIYTLIPQN